MAELTFTVTDGQGNKSAPFAVTIDVASGVSDNFNRSSLGPNWLSHLGNASIVAGADWGPSAAFGIHITSWTAPVGVDQFAEATVAAGVNPKMQYQVYVRRRASDAARYGFHYNFEASPPRWEIKYDGVPTSLTRIVATSSAPTPGPGSKLRLEARGSGAAVSLKGYHNGTLVCSGDDTNSDRITTAGPPGLVCRAFVGQTITYPSPVWTDFTTGALTPPLPPVPVVFVSPDATGSGDGSFDAPWTLAQMQTSVKAGDQVWLRGGTYRSSGLPAAASWVTVAANGTDTEPIRISSYPGELATFDDARHGGIEGKTWHVTGRYIELRDIHITNSDPFRTSAAQTAERPHGVMFNSPEGSLINCLIDNTGIAVGLYSAGTNAKMVGIVARDFGWTRNNSPTGYGVYGQSDSSHLIEDSLFFGGYGWNLHLYATNTVIDDITLRNVVSVDGRALTALNVATDILGTSSASLVHDLTLDRFFTYGVIPGNAVTTLTGTGLRIARSLFINGAGFDALVLAGGTQLKQMTDNRLFNRTGDRIFGVSTNASFDTPEVDRNDYRSNIPSNTFLDQGVFRNLAGWKAAHSWDAASTWTDTNGVLPDLHEVWTNPAEIGRATIAFLNGSSAASATVDLSSVLDPGEEYWLYDARNPLDGAFATGFYTGPVTVRFTDMPGRPLPVGGTFIPADHSAACPVVIVRRVGPQWVAPPLELSTPE